MSMSYHDTMPSAEEVLAYDMKSTREPLSPEYEEGDDQVHRITQDDGFQKLSADVSALSQKVGKMEKKLNSIKLSSADIRAAKTFAKELFKSSTQMGYDSLSGRMKAAEDDICQLGEELDEQSEIYDKAIANNLRKTDDLTALTYLIMTLTSVHIFISAVIGTGKLIGMIMNGISGRRKR